MGGPTFNATVSGTGNPGVLGTSTSGWGVQGRSTSGVGVYGEGVDGVVGYSPNDTGLVGASGTSAPHVPSSVGVVGTSSIGPGVVGLSSINTGVYGECTGGPDVGGIGVHGVAPRVGQGDIGVKGEGHTGVEGISTSTSGSGVRGTSTSGSGVRGTSDSGTGVRGNSTGTSGLGVRGISTGLAGTGVEGNSITGPGVSGRCEKPDPRFIGAVAGFFDGGIDVFNGTKHFRIDHPLDPQNKYLVHTCVESSEMKNVYDGVTRLDKDGAVWVELPEWFEALNGDFRYQLTAVGGAAPNLHLAEEISENRFKIAGGEEGMKVCWQVTGSRRDPWAAANPFEVELEKHEGERGRYLNPSLYGAPEEQRVTIVPMAEALDEEQQAPEPSAIDLARLEEEH
jgi:hypothetical protein